MKILIQNGHVVDPMTGLDEVCDVLVHDTDIEKVEKNLEAEADRVIDASGCYVMPGFIDLHVHLRDPGLTQKETLSTGGMAAARGGVTTVCAMPNTNPVIDTKEKVEEVHRRAKEESPIHVIQLGSMTMSEYGRELSDIEGMAQAGCCALSEDGKSVMNASLFRQAMKKAKEHGLLIFSHCEDISMVEGGVMNAGKRAEELGVKGITNAVEDVIAARDILIAKELDATLHLCHCSTADSVRMIKDAKEVGLKVTGEVCPHHFILADEDIPENNGIWKMNPPLRSRADVEALRQGLKDGVMDVISTDHAPHMMSEKDKPMEQAAFGIVGLETSACLTYTELVEKGVLTVMQMAEKMSYNPAKILGLKDRGSVSAGKKADIVVFDPRREYQIDVDTFASKGKNTPFDGWKVKGEVCCTLADGKIVYEK
ncbi:dihydroorotase [Mediterraneibacter gnavus]|uniref:dihydroorotase n=1 Tax=Mediterraneibacter gnavus TaxID=33038 RepID=UPI0023313FB8|nr:dihydroorotase [Mediterraneibacter gnavus]MDB8709474.1 dihydroorotase [Mediterraneibacter gnavus]MDB8712240.1 dihydroorotase [Mediterraneibacter gnavus]